jgi:hypothetical protein
LVLERRKRRERKWEKRGRCVFLLRYRHWVPFSLWIALGDA